MDKLIELLSDTEALNKVILNLSNYIVYFYPGIMTFYFSNFLESHSTKNNKAFIIKIFAVSYIYNILLGRIVIIKSNILLYNAILVIMSLVVPYVLYKIKYSKLLESFCEDLNIRTCIKGEEIDALLDGEKEDAFVFLRIFIKDENTIYGGYLCRHEVDPELIKYIILSSPIKWRIGKNGTEHFIKTSELKNSTEKVLIRFENIKHIEKYDHENAKCKFYCETNLSECIADAKDA